MSDYQHVLVAIDFADQSGRILEKARDIALRNQARLSLLHVVEYLPPIDSAYEPIASAYPAIDEEALLARGEKTLNEMCRAYDLDQLKIPLELIIQAGTPRYEISQCAIDRHCDLIVMGSHGRHGIRLLLGSTANAVLHDMPCDILAVRLEQN